MCRALCAQLCATAAFPHVAPERWSRVLQATQLESESAQALTHRAKPSPITPSPLATNSGRVFHVLGPGMEMNRTLINLCQVNHTTPLKSQWMNRGMEPSLWSTEWSGQDGQLWTGCLGAGPGSASYTKSESPEPGLPPCKVEIITAPSWAKSCKK